MISLQHLLYDYFVKKDTSILRLTARVKKQEKLKEALGVMAQGVAKKESPLMVFDGSAHTDIHTALPFTQEDYFDLLDVTGRIIRDDKSGFISSKQPKILSQFGINLAKWIDHVKCFGVRYANCAGSAENLIGYAALFQRRWAKGVNTASRLYMT